MKLMVRNSSTLETTHTSSAATVAETDASSPESQSSVSSSSELAQLREEVNILQTLCSDQKRHIRWLKHKISVLQKNEHRAM